MIPPWIRHHEEDVALAVKVQPRASKNEIVGTLGTELKIRISAPPVDSAANDMLVDFVAEILGCRRQQVTLLRGATSRSKLLLIRGGVDLITEKLLSTNAGA